MTEFRACVSDSRYQIGDDGTVVGPFGRPLVHLSNGRYGYLSVSIGRVRREYVHRLVAETFIGPANGRDVDHIDGDVKNNRLSNLRYLSHAENMKAQRERKPNCAKGHPYLEYGRWTRNGRRFCVECRRARDRLRGGSK